MSKHGKYYLIMSALLLMMTAPISCFSLDIDMIRSRAEKGDVSAQAELGKYYYELRR